MSNKKKIVIFIVMILAILFSFLGGHTYAKNMSNIKGNGVADIASWSFKVNENEEKIQTISLKSTVNNSTLVNNKIAPGTSGNFQIKLDATGSDVAISYVIRFENESNKPANLKFKYDNKTYNSITELQEALTGVINTNDESKEKILDIQWVWPYETGNNAEQIAKSDQIDTENGKNISNYTFDIVITGTQVRPD